LGQRYHTRPSAILEFEDAWAAYQFDLVVMFVAARAEAARRPGGAGRSRDYTQAPPVPADASGFRSPLPFVSKKIRISDYPNGLW
jgi:hypothetical protein